MSLLTKIALILVSVVSHGISSTREGQDPRIEFARLLDLLFGLGICGFLAWKLRLFEIEPIQASGYDAIAPLMIALAMLGLKAVLFVLLPAVFLCRLLRRFESLTPRLLIYGLVALAGVGIHLAAQRASRAEAARLSQELAAKVASQQQLQREALTMELARVNAAQREAGELKSDRAKLLALRNQARDRWRADVQSARAFGAEGEVPPMLRVSQNGPHEVDVTNVAAGKACVNLVRVMRKPGTDIYLRCPADLYRACQDIARSATLRFHLQLDERSPACRERQYEYRVGSPLKPEPSWWSASALAYFDANPPDMREPEISQEILTVRNEIAQLEKRLAR